MALVATVGLDYFENGEPLPVVSKVATAGVDYFDQGEWLAVAVAASSGTGVTVTPGLLTLTNTLFAPTVTAERHVAVSPGLLTLAITLLAPIVSITEISRPTSDVSIGGWTTDTGATTNLFDAINETSPSDSDYIRSGTSPSADVVELALGSLNDPGVNTNFRVRYRYGKSEAAGEQIDLTVALVQGTTVIASWAHTNVSDTLATVTQTLTEGEAAGVTNFADLRLRFTAEAA